MKTGSFAIFGVVSGMRPLNCSVGSDVDMQDPQYAVTKTAKPPPKQQTVAILYVLQILVLARFQLSG